MEDSSSITVFNINAVHENQSESLEEIRFRQMKKRQGFNTFGPNSATPDKYSYTGAAIGNSQTWQTRPSNYSSGFSSNNGFGGTSSGFSSGQSFSNNNSGLGNQSNSFSSGNSFNRPGYQSQNNYANNSFSNVNQGNNPFKPNTPVNNSFAGSFNPGNSGTGYAGNPFSQTSQGNGFNTSGNNPFNVSSGQGSFNGSSGGYSSGFPSSSIRPQNLTQPSQSNPFSSQSLNSNPFNPLTTGNSSTSNSFTSSLPQALPYSSSTQMNPFASSISPQSTSSGFQSNPFANGSSSNPFMTGSSSLQSNPFNNSSSGFQPNPFNGSGFSSNSFNGSSNGSSFFTTSQVGPSPSSWSNPSHQSNAFNQSSFYSNPMRPNQFTSVTPSFYSQPSGFFQSSSNPYLHSGFYGQSSVWPSDSGQMPNFGGSMYNMTSTLTNTAKPDFPVLVNPFKDPHGLTWIFPDEDPEKLVNEFKIKETTPQVSSLASRKAPEAPVPLGSKREENFNINEPVGLFSRFKREEGLCFVKREKSKKIKFKRNIQDVGTVIQPKMVEIKEEPIEFLVIVYDSDVEEKLKISAFLYSTVSDIREKVMQALNTNKLFVMKFNDRVLQGYETVANLGIDSNSKLFFETQTEEYPEEHHLPVTQSLKVTPDLEQMKRMSLKQLKNVENLVLENVFGKIVFEGKVDVVGIDFDQFICFKSQQFIGFPNGEISDQRLNRPAFVTLYNIKPRKNPGKVEIDLRIKCEENGTEFIKYDQLTHQFTFKIQHL